MSYLKSIIYLHRAPSSDEDQYGQRDMVAGIRRVKHELFKVYHLPTSRAIMHGPAVHVSVYRAVLHTVSTDGRVT